MLRPDRRLIILGIILALIAIVAAGVLAAVLLSPRQAACQVKFASTDPAAGVEIRVPDLGWNRPLGTTPFSASVALPAGPHTYLAAAPGYRAASGQFTISGALDPLQVQVPALARLGGQIEVRSSAAAQVSVNGQPAGTVEPNRWTPLGRYDPGRYTVQASTALGSQQMAIAVGEDSAGRADFYWGSRLVVAVVPTNVFSLTVTVDGRPYTGPVEYGYSQMAQKPFVHVEAAAPEYLGWADSVFLQPGDVTTATATLAADTREADILAAYWHYWDVWIAAGKEMDASHLTEVITGTMLTSMTQGIEAGRQIGISAFIEEPSAHTPTVNLLSGTTATVWAVFDLKQTTVQQDGSSTTYTNHQDGEYTFVKGPDGAWRAAGWTSLAPVATVSPTPASGGGGGGGGSGGGGGDGGGGPAGLADRGLVVQIILASINCLRAEQGLSPVVWDQEIAGTLAPLADEAEAAYRDHMTYPPELEARVDAALQPLGARVIGWKGITLSPVNMAPGVFAYDWENYVDRPCDTRYGTGGGEAWAGSFSRIGIAIGAPSWTGVWWSSTIILAVR